MTDGHREGSGRTWHDDQRTGALLARGGEREAQKVTCQLASWEALLARGGERMAS